MNPVGAPRRGERSDEVANLQQALEAAVSHGAVDVPGGEREALLAQVADERGAMVYDATARLVALTQEHFGLPAASEVDAATADALKGWLRDQGLPDDDLLQVEGRVAFSDGRPAAALRVLAYRVRMRRRDTLGEAITVEDGRYSIRYSGGGNGREATAVLRVAVLDSEGHEVVTSPDVFKPGSHETIDLTLPAPGDERSEFERYVTGLNAHLEGISLREVDEAEVHFLAGATGIPVEHLRLLVEATRHAYDVGDAVVPHVTGWKTNPYPGLSLRKMFKV
jgi:hypothetical protein